MAKIYEDKTYPSTTRSICVGRKCDLCRIEVLGDDWDSGRYEINETEVSITVRAKKGENYPEGGNGTEYEIDICPLCFTSKLIPWLKSQGADIEEKEWDW